MSSSPSKPLASRLTRRAIDLLAISFLLMIGLSVGSQLIEWWRTDPQAAMPDLTGLADGDLDWSRTPITLQFGEASTSIERIPVQGDRKRLDEELTKLAKRLVNSSQLPAVPATDVESDWLAALQTAPPVLWDSTIGNVYRRHDALPSFVATRFVENVEPEASGLTQRVVGWGLAFPSGPADWTIYVFRPEGVRTENAQELADVLLPENARRITHLRGADGCQWLVFQGRGDLDRWVQHFDQTFDTTTAGSRTRMTASASVKYRTLDSVVDLQIRRERNGTLTGVVWLAPKNSRTSEQPGRG